jgi:integrase
MTYGDVTRLFERLQAKTEISASSHALRHSSLTALAASGDWRPEHLQRRAGHATFQMTYQMYAHPNDEAIRADWERTEAAVRIRPSHGEDAE